MLHSFPTRRSSDLVLLALAQRRDLLPSEVTALLPDADAIEAALASFFDQPPRPHAELLKVVGIDLEQVRSAVRQTFGDSALEDLGRRHVHQPWQPWRRPRRRCMSILAGSMSIAPRLKRAFEGARQHADRRSLSAIDPATLMLGVVEVEDALANRILRDLGVDLEELRRSLRGVTG
jgi:ATP-dependent Clp protease ATP-binding subunit ClpA